MFELLVTEIRNARSNQTAIGNAFQDDFQWPMSSHVEKFKNVGRAMIRQHGEISIYIEPKHGAIGSANPFGTRWQRHVLHRHQMCVCGAQHYMVLASSTVVDERVSADQVAVETFNQLDIFQSPQFA